MSVQAITWALDYAASGVAEKVILLVLANYANEYGISWPSQKTLPADPCRASIRGLPQTGPHPSECAGILQG